MPDLEAAVAGTPLLPFLLAALLAAVQAREVPTGLDLPAAVTSVTSTVGYVG